MNNGIELGKGHPPYPDPPESAGEWGTKTSPQDKATGTIQKVGARLGQSGTAVSTKLASALLKHYLDNTGTPYRLSEKDMGNLADDPQVRRDINKRIRAHKTSAIERVKRGEANPGDEITQKDTTWSVTGIENAKGNPDGYLAVNKFSISVETVIVVHDDGNGGYSTELVEATVYLYDYYDYDPGSDKNPGGHARELSDKGQAKGFPVYGKKVITKRSVGKGRSNAMGK